MEDIYSSQVENYSAAVKPQDSTQLIPKIADGKDTDPRSTSQPTPFISIVRFSFHLVLGLPSNMFRIFPHKDFAYISVFVV
jgi:hypothetical protein